MIPHDTQVIIHSTTSADLDGEIAWVVGVVSIFPSGTIYILKLNKFVAGYDTIALTEHCFDIV